MDSYTDGLVLVRLLFQRGLAVLYLIAFTSALLQFRALLGERGLLPVPRFVRAVRFRDAPSLFHLHYSDRLFAVVAWVGIAASVTAVLGLSEAGSPWLSAGIWLLLWVLYLSIVNVGQTFYGFGWESMLLEAGFFAIFLGSSAVAPSAVPVLALRWMLFRTEFGAGLIKVRNDQCWRDLTCLYYHYETQPLPNPLSAYFHALPKGVHRAGVVFSHFVQLVAPFGLFFPQPIAACAGALIIFHQLLLIVSGNYAWLNWLTVVLGITAFSDPILASVLPIAAAPTVARSTAHEGVMYALAAVTVLLSIKPTLNFFSRHQRMNASYNPLHIVNSYGAFGSVTRERHEVVLEGTSSDDPNTDSWQEYGFRAKPGDMRRHPRQIAPYHLRLDWLMWFLPLGGSFRHEQWFLALVLKLLSGERAIKKLLRHDPFAQAPPRWIRARLYHYSYAGREERNATGNFWHRDLLGDFLSPVSLRDIVRTNAMGSRAA